LAKAMLFLLVIPAAIVAVLAFVMWAIGLVAIGDSA
jgi:hypothetical protein